MLRLVNTAMSALLCVACAPQDRQAAPVSSEVGSASALPSSVAQSQEAVDAGGGPSSGAPEEQAQAEGPALASRKATTMCIENLSSVTPVVTFVRYIEQAGEGALAFRARACATGFSSSDRDVRGRVGLPAHIAPMEFWADNYSVSYPGGGLSQEGAAICLATGGTPLVSAGCGTTDSCDTSLSASQTALGRYSASLLVTAQGLRPMASLPLAPVLSRARPPCDFPRDQKVCAEPRPCDH